MTRHPKARFALCVVLLLTCVALVQAANLAERRFGVRWHQQTPYISVSAVDFLSRDVQHKLRSGLPQTIVLQAIAYKSPSKKPLAAYAHTCRVVFDIWDEVFHVERVTLHSQSSFLMKSPHEIIKICLDLQRVRIGDPRVYRDKQGQDIYVALLVELNPLSEKTIERIRRWLVRPGGNKGLGEDSFYGSFVSLFVNPRIGTADRSLRFRSQTMHVPGASRTSKP